MAFAIAAALLFALDEALVTASYASFGGLGDLTTYKDLAIASGWIQVVLGVAALMGVSGALWLLVVHQQWQLAWEATAATVGTLLIAIGTLVRACTILTPQATAYILTAIGVGIWAVLALVVAARWAVAEQSSGVRTAIAPTWLFASVALVIVAVGVGLPKGAVSDKGLVIANGVIGAVGFGALAVVVAYAYASGFLARPFATISGLATLAVGETVLAIVAGVVIHTDAGLTSIRIGFSLVAAVMAVGFVVLAYAGWERLRRLPPVAGRVVVRPVAQATGFSPTPPDPPAPTFGAGPRFCAQCGAPLSTGARFCTRCGAPIASRQP